jgi:hypothetical protein
MINFERKKNDVTLDAPEAVITAHWPVY